MDVVSCERDWREMIELGFHGNSIRSITGDAKYALFVDVVDKKGQKLINQVRLMGIITMGHGCL